MKRLLMLGLLAGLLAAPAFARKHGDFAPRGSLLYGRVTDLGKSLRGFASKDWQLPIERMLATLDKRTAERVNPLVAAIRPFLLNAKGVEFCIADVMIRAAFVQTITVVDLAPGAPARPAGVVGSDFAFRASPEGSVRSLTTNFARANLACHSIDRTPGRTPLFPSR